MFVHGCFWHGHDCHLFKWPSTRPSFWKEKIENNILRDNTAIQKLTENGWKVLTIWECSMRGRTRLDFNELMSIVTKWLVFGDIRQEVRGVKEDRDDSL